MSKKIGLIPLDERPANTRYPAMIAAIGGAELLLPPAEILSECRRPADCAALADWLARVAPDLDALVVSCEMLGYGGLIASRTSHDPAALVLARLDALRALRQAHPSLTIYGFSVIARVSNADDAAEEPDYWASYGARLFRLSQLLDRQEQGQLVGGELAALAGEIPAEHRADFLGRRMRNHAANLAALQLLADGVLDLLVLSSDDTSPYGLPSREKRWLAGWGAVLGLGGPQPGAGPQPEGAPEPPQVYDTQTWDLSVGLEPSAESHERVAAEDSQPVQAGFARLLMYPGADEVGCALVARALCGGAGPSVAASYAPPTGAEQVAAYEDAPVRLTVERQVAAIGGRLVSHGAEIWLGVCAPLARRAEWSPAHAEAERDERLPALQVLVAEARWRMQAGQAVALADVAYPNGADPALTELLLGEADLSRLAAYGAWNTAGNTIGCALAQASVARLATTPERQAAHERFLLHRLIEDWGYQQVVRADIRAWLRDEHGLAEPTEALMPAVQARIARGLNTLLGRLPGFAGRYRVAPGSVRLPWGRTFEVDFDLAAV